MFASLNGPGIEAAMPAITVFPNGVSARVIVTKDMTTAVRLRVEKCFVMSEPSQPK